MELKRSVRFFTNWAGLVFLMSINLILVFNLSVPVSITIGYISACVAMCTAPKWLCTNRLATFLGVVAMCVTVIVAMFVSNSLTPEGFVVLMVVLGLVGWQLDEV